MADARRRRRRHRRPAHGDASVSAGSSGGPDDQPCAADRGRAGRTVDRAHVPRGGIRGSGRGAPGRAHSAARVQSLGAKRLRDPRRPHPRRLGATDPADPAQRRLGSGRGDQSAKPVRDRHSRHGDRRCRPRLHAGLRFTAGAAAERFPLGVRVEHRHRGGHVEEGAGSAVRGLSRCCWCHVLLGFVARANRHRTAVPQPLDVHTCSPDPDHPFGRGLPLWDPACTHRIARRRRRAR